MNKNIYNDKASNKYRDNPKSNDPFGQNKSDRQRRRERSRFINLATCSCASHPLWNILSDDEKYHIYTSYQCGPGNSARYLWTNQNLTFTTEDAYFEGTLLQFVDFVIEHTEEYRKYKRKLRDLIIDQLLQ